MLRCLIFSTSISVNIQLLIKCRKSQHSTWGQWGTEARVIKNLDSAENQTNRVYVLFCEPKGSPTSWNRAVLNQLELLTRSHNLSYSLGDECWDYYCLIKYCTTAGQLYPSRGLAHWTLCMCHYLEKSKLSVCSSLIGNLNRCFLPCFIIVG